MSIYEDRVINHPVRGKIDEVKEKVEVLLSESTNKDVIEHLQRILEATIYAEKLINKCSDILVPKGVLDKTGNIIENIGGDLVNFEKNEQVDQLTTANNRVDNLLMNLQQLPQAHDESYSLIVSESASEYRKAIINVIEAISGKKEDIKNEINKLSGLVDNQVSAMNKLKGDIESQKARLDSAIAQFQQQFSEAEDRRRETFENEVKSRNDEFQNTKTNFVSQIRQFLDEKKKETNDAISIYKEETKTTIDDFQQSTSSLINSHKNQAEETISFLGEKREEAAKLLDVIGNIGFTGNYNKIASQEKKTANSWRFAAIFFMLFGIAVIGTIIFNIGKTGFDWKLVLTRVAVTITIFVPALYAARESSQHRQREMYNRKMELELASIGPFLELLPDDKKFDLKSELSKKFFGQPQDTTNDKGETISANALFRLVDKLLTNLTKK